MFYGLELPRKRIIQILLAVLILVLLRFLQPIIGFSMDFAIWKIKSDAIIILALLYLIYQILKRRIQ